MKKTFIEEDTSSFYAEERDRSRFTLLESELYSPCKEAQSQLVGMPSHTPTRKKLMFEDQQSKPECEFLRNSETKKHSKLKIKEGYSDSESSEWSGQL